MNNKKIGFLFPAFAMKFTGNLSLYQNEVDELTALAARHVSIDAKHFEEMKAGSIEDELQAHYFCYINSGAVSTIMKKINTEYVAGYSMGLYTAIFHSQAVSFEDGLLLMHNIYNIAFDSIDKKKYGMGVVVGLTYDSVNRLINDNSKDIEIIDISNEHVINVTGIYDDVVNFLEIAGKTALSTKMLPITLPYHSKFTNNASEKIRQFLADIHIKPPVCKIISCVNQKVLSTAQDIKDELLINVSHSINWLKTMQKLLDLEVSLFIECGMSKSLTQLAKFINGDYKIYNINNFSKIPGFNH
jgi:[acyl-carrier-protein] S-malonyltransferase